MSIEFSILGVATNIVDPIIDIPYMNPKNPCENCRFYNVDFRTCTSPRKGTNPHRARKDEHCYSHEEIRIDEGGMRRAF